MKKTTYTVTRFDIDDEFYVEVSPSTDNEGEEMYDFVLCKEDYGIKSFMFGLFAKNCPPHIWEDMIEANVDDYIEYFNEDMEYLEDRP